MPNYYLVVHKQRKLYLGPTVAGRANLETDLTRARVFDSALEAQDELHRQLPEFVNQYRVVRQEGV